MLKASKINIDQVVFKVKPGSIVEYRSPHHITGFWYPVRSDDPLTTGSLGAGILVEPGIVGRGSTNKCGVIIDSNCLELPVSRVIREATGIEKSVSADPSIPLGMGGAVSAFISIALSCEVLRSYSRSCVSREALLEASGLAHKAEVLSLTGLGDVIAMITGGGLVLRLKPGAPGYGEAIAIRDPGLDRVFFTIAIIERRITTPDMLSSMWDRISSYGSEAYRDFQRDPGFERFLEISNRFSRNIGFLSGDLGEAITRTLDPFVRRGEALGYYAKKSLLVIAHERGSEDISRSLLGVAKKVLGIYRPAGRGFEAFEHNMDTPESS